MTVKKILVHMDLLKTTIRVGTLYPHVRRGRESATFEYDKDWLRNPVRFPLEPALSLGEGPFHTPANKALFGSLGDSSPDRWGRVLMRRAERQNARQENRTPRTLWESDYLLSVNDIARQGALRFSTSDTGPYLAPDNHPPIPPWVKLSALLSAATLITQDTATENDLRLLLAPGSSLGGARPKASVQEKGGALAIAKFPHTEDEVDVVSWEAVTLQLAKRAGIPTPTWEKVTVKRKPVLIVRRFDRIGAERIPFLSAMSMIGAADNETHSYLEIADALRRHSASPKQDLHQLWRRMVFNILVSNTDDHLRNHGFLYQGQQGWNLSPAYDLNPVPVDIRPRILSTAIDEQDTTASLELAYHVANYFELNPQQARSVAKEVAAATATWREIATAHKLKNAEIERMETAFEHRDSEQALRS